VDTRDFLPQFAKSLGSARVDRQVLQLSPGRLRQAVEQDGGAITYHSYHDKKVTVSLQGSCSGCPSSTITLKAGIENLFKKMMPEEVEEVEALGALN